MMREIEKLFETLKDDFNQRINNISYFTNSDVGDSISDYEDISLNGYDIHENDSLTIENTFETGDCDSKLIFPAKDDTISDIQDIKNSIEIEMLISDKDEIFISSFTGACDNENQLTPIDNNNQSSFKTLRKISENITIFQDGQDDQACVTIETDPIDTQPENDNDSSKSKLIDDIVENEPTFRRDNEELSDIDEKHNITELKDENKVIEIENEVTSTEKISERENIDVKAPIEKPLQIEYLEDILAERKLTNVIKACERIELIHDSEAVESKSENNIVKETKPNQETCELQTSNITEEHEKINVKPNEIQICQIKESEDLVTQPENEPNDFLAEYEQVEMEVDYKNAFSEVFDCEQLSDSENNHESDRSEHTSSGIDSKFIDEIKSEKAACSLKMADVSDQSPLNNDMIMANQINEPSNYRRLSKTINNASKKPKLNPKPNFVHLDKKQKYKSQTEQVSNVNIRKISSERSSARKPFRHSSSNRKMWSEMLEVIESDNLFTLSKKEIQLQEAMFEIITSEASYFQSLMILTTHFFDSVLFKENKENIVSPMDKHHIFSNVILIMKTSKNLLNDLEQRWHEEKPVLTDICDVVLNHVTSYDFQNYVTYLRNQQYQTKALKRLSENESFKQQLSKLEASPICGKLALDSYLMLPMQRLTRLKLLVEAVTNLQNSEELKYKVKTSSKQNSSDALEKIKKLLSTSNTEKGLMDQKGVLISLINRIDFPPNLKRITFSDRTLLREDELRIHQNTPLKTMKRISRKKQPLITLLLFNDLLIITKKKSGRLLVLDYGSKNNVEAKLKLYMKDNSSNDVSSNTSTHDVNSESHSPLKSIGPTLIRSKTSLSSDEKKRLSIPISNTFISMPSVNEIECNETTNQTFTLQLNDSISGIFNSPVYLTAKNREERDLWLSYFKSDRLMTEDIRNQSKSNAPKLHKSKSLKSNSNFSNIPTSSKRYSYKKSKEERKTLININKFLEVKDVLLNSVKFTSL